ncbi:MAG: hypothetical protein PHE83_13265 [Opitutaceae bacterium]|nr:hypothetical protein [Opitutaceae bacterium]
MNPHESIILHLLHVAAALVLMGYTFYAFAAAPETRKRVLIWTGGASLVMLLTGLRMWQGLYGFAPAGWLIVKLICWLGLSALAGIAYRKRGKAGLLAGVALILAVTAVAMVYVKPF